MHLAAGVLRVEREVSVERVVRESRIGVRWEFEGVSGAGEAGMHLATPKTILPGAEGGEMHLAAGVVRVEREVRVVSVEREVRESRIGVRWEFEGVSGAGEAGMHLATPKTILPGAEEAISHLGGYLDVAPGARQSAGERGNLPWGAAICT